MADLAGLIERVRSGEGEDRELDAAIAIALGHEIDWHPGGDIRNANSGPVIRWQKPHPYAGMREPCPWWTTSLDAVVRLVEEKLPGWGYSIDVDGTDCCGALHSTDAIVSETAFTGSRALLAALLLALQAQEAEGT